MSSGMWPAVAGASAQSQNLDAIANNLANADTPAFKKDTTTFKEYLVSAERTRGAEDIPRGQIKDKDLYHLDGRDQSSVVIDGTHTSFRQGNLRVTQGQFDVAMDGPGFLEVSTPNGIRFTRMGSLKVAQDGRLVTSEGYPVLATKPSGLAGDLNGIPESSLSHSGPSQNSIAGRFINLRDQGSQFTISPQGEIYAGGNLIAKLSVSEFSDLGKLKKYGSQLFENLDPKNQNASNHTLVRQGVIETSNVNPIEEMTNMIKTNRLFEADLKALKTYGDLMGREVNDIGKL